MTTEQCRALAARAARAARMVRGYAVASFIAGWIVAGASLVALATDVLRFSDAVDILLVIGIGGVISGVALFASSWSLEVAATRLALDIESKSPPG